MTEVLITVDTELSSSLENRGVSIEDNFERSILGQVGGKEYGVNWLMDRMDNAGVKGVFFVDPFPGLVHGLPVVERMVEPVLRRGHDVEVHIHTEWLAWAKSRPVSSVARNIGDYSLDDQKILIGLARELLIRAGASNPTAFRAGNFGASDSTLDALSALGLRWDSSFNADFVGRACSITLPPELVDPTKVGDLYEAPVAGIWDWPGHFRPAQVCAISAREMRNGLLHSAANGVHSFVVVTHSFEMLSRDRQRPNWMVMKRFESLCDTIRQHSGLRSVTFTDLSYPPADHRPANNERRLPPNRLRTLERILQQGLGAWRYEGARRRRS